MPLPSPHWCCSRPQHRTLAGISNLGDEAITPLTPPAAVLNTLDGNTIAIDATAITTSLVLQQTSTLRTTPASAPVMRPSPSLTPPMQPSSTPSTQHLRHHRCHCRHHSHWCCRRPDSTTPPVSATLAMKPSVSSGTASTSQANTLAAATSGIVTATISDGDLATLAGLTETGNAYSITISDTSVDAAALNTLDGKTTVAIDATAITTSLVLPQTSTPPTTPPASATSVMRPSPSLTPPHRSRPQHP